MLAGRRAHSVVYTVSDNGNKLKIMDIWMLKNFKTYSIIYHPVILVFLLNQV